MIFFYEVHFFKREEWELSAQRVVNHFVNFSRSIFWCIWYIITETAQTVTASVLPREVINKYWRLLPAAVGGFSPQPWIDVFIPSFVLNSNAPVLITFSCKRFLINFHIILMWRWACFRVKRFFFSFFFLSHVIELKLISRFHFVGLERRRDKEYKPKMSVKMPGKARGKIFQVPADF